MCKYSLNVPYLWESVELRRNAQSQIRIALYLERSDLAQPLIELLRYLIIHNVPANRYDLSGE
jgi:hypothetical protein